MTQDKYLRDQDPVHQALYTIVKKLLKGMDVKTRTQRSIGAEGQEVIETHRLPVFLITEFSHQYPDLRAVTNYIAPFLGADEKAPKSQRKALEGHVAPQGFEVLSNNYSAIRLVVDGKPESIVFKKHTEE
jgi:hypothetical protein